MAKKYTDFNKTIIFGSAARWTPEVWDEALEEMVPNRAPFPRDIDVLNCSGEWTPEREELVRQWAEGRGFGDLPLDIHEGDLVPTLFGMGEAVWFNRLPVETESSTSTEVLVEDGWSLEIAERRDTMDHQTFPAALRAAGRTGRPLADFLEIGEQACVVSLLPSSEGEWDKYTQGLQALRSAAHHAPEGWLWQTNCPSLLARLLVEEPTNWKSGPYWGDDFPQLGAGWSAAYTLVVGRTGDELFFTGYAGVRTYVTEEEAIRMIFG